MNTVDRQLMTCVEIGKALTSTLNVDRLLEIILQRASELIRAQNWTLYLVDPERRELRFEVVVGIDPRQVEGLRIKVGEGIAGTVAASGEPLIVPDIGLDPRFSHRVDDSTGFSTRALITLPLAAGGEVIGVLQIVNPEDTSLFDAAAVPVLSILADFVAIAITNARNHRQIENLVVTDDVSGYFNSRFLHSRLAELLAEGRRVSLVFADMDNFKRIVDTYGHPLGSKVLREVAQAMGSQLEPRDHLVRYGGDEFVIVLPDQDKASAQAKVERVRAVLEGGRFLREEGHDIEVSASFGLATCPDDASDMKELLHRADVALYRSKERGKGTLTLA